MAEIRPIQPGSADYDAACRLREDLLRRPLGLLLRPEDVADDHARLHWGAWDGEALVGSISLKLGEGVGTIKQLVVTDDVQGKGVGSALVNAAENAARERGFTRIDMNARDSAIPFYLRHGYATQGEPFMEVGLAHIVMVKDL